MTRSPLRLVAAVSSLAISMKLLLQKRMCLMSSRLREVPVGNSNCAKWKSEIDYSQKNCRVSFQARKRGRGGMEQVKCRKIVLIAILGSLPNGGEGQAASATYVIVVGSDGQKR